MSTKSTKNSKPTPTVKQLLSARFGDNYAENQPLAKFVRSGVGGVAEYVVMAHSIADLQDAGRIAAEKRVEYRVLGGGTGTLPSDVGYPGLVIINRTEGIAFGQGTSVIVAVGGVSTHGLISAAASKNLGGIEFLSAIPGSIGGAVATNAAYGRFGIGAFVKDVTAFVTDGTESRVVTITHDELQFEPRRTLLSQPSPYPPIILNVRLQLATLPQEEIVGRLRRFRERNVELLRNEPLVGGMFSPPLEAQGTLFKEMRRIKCPGIKIILERGLLVGTRGKTLARDYQLCLAQLKQVAADYGVVLEDRLSFLGYWPDEGSNEA